MDERYGCEQARDLLAELATGAAAGQERAALLRHVATCSTCRSELTELTKVADDLLLLAPPAEPPTGFESAVLARLSATTRPAPHQVRPVPRRRARSRPRLLAGALALLVAAALGAGLTWWRTAADRALAAETRQTQTIANGRHLEAARLRAADGTGTGTVFLYDGNPSWLLVSLSSAPVDGAYEVVVVHIDGLRYAIGACQVSGGSGTTAYRLPASTAGIAGIEMTGPSGIRLAAEV
jgi:anti-sigma factor RsiW